MTAPATMLPKYKNASQGYSAGTGGGYTQGSGFPVKRQSSEPPREERQVRELREEVREERPAPREDNRQFELMSQERPPEKGHLKKLVAELGAIDVGQDEYDIPTFLRKQAD